MGQSGLRAVLVLATLASAMAFLSARVGSRSLRLPRLASSSEFTDDERFDSISGMRVSEIKAELDLRGVNYTDCFEADELRKRLEEARLSGKANVGAVDAFNRAQVEAMAGDEATKAVKDMSVDEMSDAAAGDGTLPGGMRPEEMQQLMGNPEIMALLANPKLQDIMKAQMAGDAAQTQKLLSDPANMEMMQKLNKALADTGMVPPDMQ